MEEEYCWVITQAAVSLCCGPLSSSVFDFGFKLGFIFYSYIVEHKYTHLAPRLKKE